LNGWILFGLSTAFLYRVIQRAWPLVSEQPGEKRVCGRWKFDGPWEMISQREGVQENQSSLTATSPMACDALPGLERPG